MPDERLGEYGPSFLLRVALNQSVSQGTSPSGPGDQPLSNHFDERGQARMVDVSSKPVTQRSAIAEAVVTMNEQVAQRVRGAAVAKGDVLAIARLAGIMAAKRTGELIPLCHPIGLDAVEIEFTWAETSSDAPSRLVCRCRATNRGRTGVEMEAMAAVSVTALTVYDMLKGQQRDIAIESVRLLEKSGGRSGHWVRGETDGFVADPPNPTAENGE